MDIQTAAAPRRQACSPQVAARAGDRVPGGQSQRQRFARIDLERRKAKVSVAELVTAAGLNFLMWYHGKKGAVVTRPSTLDKIEAALTMLKAGRRQVTPMAVRPLIHSIEFMLRRLISQRGLTAACNGGRAAMPAGRLRTFAIYLAAVELNIQNAEIAHALKMSRENARKARDKIEDLREAEPKIDRLLTCCAAILRGETP